MLAKRKRPIEYHLIILFFVLIVMALAEVVDYIQIFNNPINQTKGPTNRQRGHIEKGW